MSKIQYTLLRKAKRKSIAISICKKGKVTVHAPKRTPELFIDTLILQKENWILQKLNTIQKKNEQIVYHTFEDGDQFLYLGKHLELQIFKSEKENIFISQNQLIVSLKDRNDKEKIKKMIEKWYKNTAKDIIKDRILIFSKIINVKVNEIRLKNTKTRWGSCSSKGNININWRLIMADLAILDYIVVHELCHLIHMNHSDKFWLCVKKFDPNYEKNRQWIRENGHILHFE